MLRLFLIIASILFTIVFSVISVILLILFLVSVLDSIYNVGSVNFLTFYGFLLCTAIYVYFIKLIYNNE